MTQVDIVLLFTVVIIYSLLFIYWTPKKIERCLCWLVPLNGKS